MEKTASSGEENGLKKGPWSPEEDQKLIDYIQRHGHGKWRTLPKNAGLKRCGKSCRLRWTNYLRPDIRRGKFSFEEEDIIIRLHSILGNKWSIIAAHLPGRTDNEIKNFWNTHIRKRLLRMGIDPVTHTPRHDLLDLSSLLHSAIYHPSLFNPNPNFLGLTTQPVVNNLSHATTTTITSSSQFEFPEYAAAHNLYNGNTQHCEPRFQNRVDFFQDHGQIENPNHHTTLNRSFVDENRVMCADFERCNTTHVACNCHYCSLPKLSQYKNDHHSSGEVSNSVMNYHHGRPRPTEQPFDDKIKIQNVGLFSNLSTPSSSHTHLSSSSPLTTYGNNGITTEDSADISYDDNALFYVTTQ